MDFDAVQAHSVSRLSSAARDDDAAQVRRLLRGGASPNAADNRGWTCLHEAAANGCLRVVEILLADERVDVDILTFESQTPLILAAEKDHASLVGALLDAGADVTMAPPSRRTPFIAAAENNCLNVTRLLLTRGIDVNQTYFSGWTPLHFACHGGFEDVVKCLLDSETTNLNATDIDGLTPLFLAVQKEAITVVRLLLRAARKRGILEEVVNARATDGSDVSPVFISAQEGHLECLELLVDAGADIDIHKGVEVPTRPFVMTSNEEKAERYVRVILPIHSAIERNQVDAVRFLAKRMKADSFRRSLPTPFHFCIMWNQIDCLQALISAAPVDIFSTDLLMPDFVNAEEGLVAAKVEISLGYTHLDLPGTAAYFENVSMVRLLLGRGSNPNPQNLKVFPPLLIALAAEDGDKRTTLIDALLESGANATIYHPKVKGNLALLSCLEDPFVMMKLISFGADVDSLFHPRSFKRFLYMFQKCEDVAECRPDNDALTLYRLLDSSSSSSSSPLVASSKRRFNLFQFLIPLVFPVPMREYVKYKKLLKGVDWNCLQSWTRWPPTLAQLCRRTIRLRVAGHNWVVEDGGGIVGEEEEEQQGQQPLNVGISPVAYESYHEKLERLNLPPFLISFLTFAREVEELRSEREEETAERWAKVTAAMSVNGRIDGEEGGIVGVVEDNSAEDELDLDAMD